jgi:ABC-type transporter Mla subunit MlaD
MNTIRHVILGLFFFVTLLVLGLVTIYLGDFDFRGKAQDLSAHFDNVDALGAGDPVFVWGVKRGRVTKVAFAEGDPPPERRLRVDFKLDEPLVLREGYSIEIGSPNFLGGRQLDVMAGDGPPLAAAEYHELRGKSATSIVRALTGVLGENRADLRRIVVGIGNIVEDLDQGKRAALDILLSKQTNADFQAAVASGRSVLEKADKGEGSIGRAINSSELYDQLVAFGKASSQLFTDAREKPGVVNTLIYDEELATKVKTGVGALSESAGKIGELVSEARAGRGAIGKLFADPETEQQVQNIVLRFSSIATDVAVIVEGARRGRGVVGLLFTDDQARRTAERIIDQVARAIDDAREAAPVSSVFSFLFGQL